MSAITLVRSSNTGSSTSDVLRKLNSNVQIKRLWNVQIGLNSNVGSSFERPMGRLHGGPLGMFYGYLILYVQCPCKVNVTEIEYERTIYVYKRLTYASCLGTCTYVGTANASNIAIYTCLNYISDAPNKKTF